MIIECISEKAISVSDVKSLSEGNIRIVAHTRGVMPGRIAVTMMACASRAFFTQQEFRGGNRVFRPRLSTE